MRFTNRKFIFATIISFTLAACATDTTETNTNIVPVKKVEVVPVETINYEATVSATGRLALKEEAKLSFKTGGIIAQIKVDEGQRVRKGQLLAVLDLQEIQARTQQAQLGKQQAGINIENAKLALRLAERDYENAKGLYQDSVATLEQLENAEVQLDNARNQLSAAQKALAMQDEQVAVADFNLQYSQIKAPSNGVILKKLASTNELAGPGTPIFFFGSSQKSKILRTNITDKDIINIQIGNKATITFDAYPEHFFEGVVTEIASMADPYTGTFEVEIQINDEGKELLSGFIGSASIITNTTAGLIRIPVDALLGANGNKGSVFVVEGSKAVKTDIQIYQLQDEHLLISKGLDNSDQVIISGVGYLENEQEVLIGER